MRIEVSVDLIEDEFGEYLDSNPLVHNNPIVGIEPSDHWTN